MPGLTDALEQAMAEHEEANVDAAEGGDDEPPEGGEEAPEPDEGGAEAEDQSEDEVDGDGDAEEDGDGESEDGDGGEQSDAVAVDEESTYALPDGTEVRGSELRDGWLRQADYTRKTQQLAKQNRDVKQREQQIADWLQNVRERPGDAILEVASGTDDPTSAFTSALAASGNPTANVAQVLKQLAGAGKLDPEFVEHFGIDTSDGPVGQQADQAAKDDRIERLEKRDQEREQSQRQQQMVTEYRQQWDSIKEQSELDFGDSDDAEREARIELMKFARDRQIPDLGDAYAVMERKGVGFAGKQAQAREERQKAARKSASQAVKKKRDSKVQSRRGTRVQSPKPAEGPRNLTSTIEQTFADKGITD